MFTIVKPLSYLSLFFNKLDMITTKEILSAKNFDSHMFRRVAV